MKRYLPLILALLALGPAVTFTGCSIFHAPERTPEAKKFDTYTSVYNGAREAYKGFKRECFAGRVSAAQEAKADRAWNEFRRAYDAAFRVGMENLAAPENILALKAALIAALSKL